MPLGPGSRAPDFALPLVPGEAPLRLSDYLGQRPVVLLFFPFSYSGTCAQELLTVSEEREGWEELGAAVVAVSVDSPYTNQAFAKECGAWFPIVSDFNREVISAYGVRNESFHGLEGVSHRAAFVIDRAGQIAYSWMSEDADLLPDFEAIRAAVRQSEGGDGGS